MTVAATPQAANAPDFRPVRRGALRFATGPFRATAAQTHAEWEPLLKYLGQRLGMDATLTVLDDWAALGEAMAEGRFDAAWMGGGFRYVLAHAQGAGPAIASVKVAGATTCHALVIARRGLTVEDFPADARGLSLAFTHEGSTTGWLMVQAHLVSRGIDPSTYFRCTTGHTHVQNELSVARQEVDLATDSDTNRAAMIERGAVTESDVRVAWRSQPLPQDPISIRRTLDPVVARRLRDELVAIDTAQATRIPMPAPYTGFVPASDETYRDIREASIRVGRLSAPHTQPLNGTP